MVSRVQPVHDWLVLAGLGLVLVSLLSFGCRRDHSQGSQQVAGNENIALGEVRVGGESAQFYIAYGVDSAILGFSVSTGSGPLRYFPLFASTTREVPSVVLEVFASKAETEMWVRSSWPGSETLAYRRVGAATALTPWGEMQPLETPMPDYLSGGPSPFPALPTTNVVKKATFTHN